MPEANKGQSGEAPSQAFAPLQPQSESQPTPSNPIDATIQQDVEPGTDRDLQSQIGQTLDSDFLKGGSSRDSSNDPNATAFFDSKADSTEKELSWNHSEKDAPKSKGRKSERLSAAKPSAHEPPSAIPGFKILGELGRGAFGVVYRAHDEMLDRNVAIKMPILNDPKYRQQYIEEARKSVKLEHPGIVPTYHVGVTAQGQPFVIQKLIEGRTLREYLNDKGGALSLGEALSILRPVFLAIESAHSIGLIHRDLKPENLLIDAQGRPFVADFGLAVTDDEDLSGRGEIAGTPLYMSPEQFAGKTQWWMVDPIYGRWVSSFMKCWLGKYLSTQRASRNSKSRSWEKTRDLSIKDNRTFHPVLMRSFVDAVPRTRRIDSEAFVNSLKPSTKLSTPSPKKVFSISIPISYTTVGRNQPFGSAIPSHRDAASTRRQSLTERNTVETSVAKSLTSTKVAQAWSIVGPLIAVVCTLTTIALVFGVLRMGNRDSDSSKQTALSDKHGEESQGTSASVATSESLPNSTAASLLPMINSSKTPNAEVATDTPATAVPPSSADDSKMDTLQPTEKVKQKPFRVSAKADNATHSTLKLAIAESSAGDTIFVGEGIYRESVVIDKDLRIVGDGEKQNVSFQADGTPCISVMSEANVHIENVKLKTNRLNDSHANTIDVRRAKSNW